MDARGSTLRIGSSGHPTVLALLGAGPDGAPDPHPIVERMKELPSRLPQQPLDLIAAPLVPGIAVPDPVIFAAAGPMPAIRDLAAELGVMVAREGAGWIAGHAVVVADDDRRIVTLFRGTSGWTAADLARAVARAAGR